MKTVLLPGLDGTGDLFSQFVAATPPELTTQVVRYPPNAQLSYDDCKRFVLRELDVDDPFILVAESFSGPIAVGVATERPTNLRGVVLCNTFLTSPVWSGLQPLPWELLVRFPITRAAVGVFLTGWEHAGVFLPAIRAANRKVQYAVLAKRVREILAVDVRDAFRSLSLPVLYLHGSRDNLVGPSSMALALKCQPDMKVAELPGPHLLLQIAPESCWREIEKFATECTVT